MRTIIRPALAILLSFGLIAGCAGMTSTQQRTLSGGAIGAGAGAAISALSGGSVLTGTAIGAAAGAIGGLLVDQSEKNRR